LRLHVRWPAAAAARSSLNHRLRLRHAELGRARCGSPPHVHGCRRVFLLFFELRKGVRMSVLHLLDRDDSSDNERGY